MAKSFEQKNIKMRINKLLPVISIFSLLSVACNQNNRPLFRSDAFTVYHDRVEQGSFAAEALSSGHMVSDYVSLNAEIHPVIEYKFSINGRDDELAFGVNHRANIFPDGEDVVVLDMTFGKRSDLRSGKPSSLSLPANTRVKFRVDFREVIDSFREKGYYDDILGNRIFKDDFRGLYLAGDTYPLSWDFENISGNRQLTMEDPDGDGIFEQELTFNVYDPSAHTSSEWMLSNDISGYPQLKSPSPLLDALYNMALDEMVMLMEEDGTFRTGKEWAGVWTRDLSYSAMLAMAYLDPGRCMTGLMKKVDGERIIQDTGTGGAWPVSSDRVVWSLAAWEIYKYTGDREWLKQAFEITRHSVEDDSRTIADNATGLMRGESSFLDWRKQTYPLWMEPSDIYCSLNLGTNAAYCQALKVLGMMAIELGVEDEWSGRAESLKDSINSHLWQEDKGYYGQYLYGRYYRSLSPRAEALGESFTVLFDIATQDRKLRVLRNTPATPYGVTCIFPQIPGIPPYHNDAVWPFVQAFWTLANAGEKQSDAVEYGFASIIRPAALFLTNKENFVAGNGDFAGTEINSDRQLWSVSAMLAMQHRIIFGISFGTDYMKFNPLIPRSFRGNYTLTSFPYRKGLYNISINGWGDGISSFRIDGEESAEHLIPAGMTGTHDIEIVMNRKAAEGSFKVTEDRTAPGTPDLSTGNNTISWSPVENAAGYQVFRNGRSIATTLDTTADVHGGKDNPEYQVMAFDASGTGSFLSNPVYTAPENPVIIVEAEDFNPGSERKVEGYSGSGYLRVASDSENETIVHVNAVAGTYALRMRYANGTGPVNTDNNCGIRSLYVNGSFSGSMVFPQRGKDQWSDWGETNIEWVTLNDGENTLALRYDAFNRNMDGKINEFLLDYISLQRFR
jgi:hypothetical protein